MPAKKYVGAKTAQISFPLGGIGSGCIGLGGDGRLVDWEIFNGPNKDVKNGNSNFSVKAVSKGKLLDARVLCGELPKPYIETDAGPYHKGNPCNDTLAGFPNFRKNVFSGQMPFAKVELSDPKFPGKVALKAFNPLIPLNDKDSSIPAAFFEVEFFNDTKQEIDYSAALSIKNPAKKSLNKAFVEKGLKLIHLTDAETSPSSPDYGDICIGTDAPGASLQESWYRGGWCDALEVFWAEFATPSPVLPKRHYDAAGEFYDRGCLMATVSLKPKERKSVRFIISWNYPNHKNYVADSPWLKFAGKVPDSWLNYYATLFKDSVESAAYSLKSWERLEKESRLFSDAFHDSTIPAPALEAASANIGTLKTPTSLRIEDGSFWGWEGVHAKRGSCEGTCTHVWNYAYAMPFLFPSLERSIRDLNYKWNLTPAGGLTFRLQLPLGIQIEHPMRSCADGQFGDVVKVYREWKISGDTAWMKSLWPSVKKTVEYAWSKENKDKWDPKKSGVLTGRQHHTLDQELFGPNSWLTGFYLAALKAAAEMAETAGEPETAKEYLAIFERGKKQVAETLFNGEWFVQKINLKDKNALSDTLDLDAIKRGEKREEADWYWNDERKEIKYQIGDGCEIDQVLAQWHANLCGLGDIFDKKQRRAALKSIWKHNFKRSLRDLPNPWRIYTLYDEAGVIICDWPKGVKRPAIPLPYHTETMYGFEHSLGALMIQEGLIDEGLEVITRCHERFDGEKRNPWNEFECGCNYARSMASYSYLNAFSGFEFDMVKGMIGFSPVMKKTAGKFFWSLASGWGAVEFAKGKIELKVLYGSLKLSEFRSKRIAKLKEATLGGKAVAAKSTKGAALFEKPVELKPGKSLVLKFA